MFITGLSFHRQNLHEKYGGQHQGGISTPSHQKFIFLFSSLRAKKFGYEDGWLDEGIYLYTGEGQRGDMTFSRGNIAIRDHQKEGKDLHLFEATSRKGYYRYIGQMFCIGYHESQGKDITGKQRSIIIFELIPLSEFAAEEMNTENGGELWQESLHDLRDYALSSASFPTMSKRKTEIYRRSQAIKTYALKRGNGICEGCGKMAPFTKEDGTPYLEVHHLSRLSDGGPDHPQSVIALCPNCHRQAHYSRDRELFNAQLTERVFEIEASM